MQALTTRSLAYRDWQIEILPLDQDFMFGCYPPDFPDFINDGETYPDVETAFDAACHFVDREIAIKALLNLAEEWLDAGLIDGEEYWQITSFE
jgi:hypothetical protein